MTQTIIDQLVNGDTVPVTGVDPRVDKPAAPADAPAGETVEPSPEPQGSAA